jgi:hypothetical protein
MANRYWVVWTDAWNSTGGTKWALTSWWAGWQTVPTSSDDVFLDLNSSWTVTVDGNQNCKNLNFTWFTGAFSLNWIIISYWSITLVSWTTYNWVWSIAMRATSGTNILTSNNSTHNYWIAINGSGWTFQLADDLVTWWSLVQTIAWTFDPNWKTIKFTRDSSTTTSFYWNGYTFYNLWIATTWTWSFNLRWSNTFNDLKIDAGRSIVLENSTTQTVTTFTASWTSWNLIKLRNTSSTTTATLAKAWGGVISCDYMDVDYIVWSPADTWYMGENSTDWGHNTNIYFEAPPVPTAIKSLNGLAYASVKSVNWLAIASVKSYNWLT